MPTVKTLWTSCCAACIPPGGHLTTAEHAQRCLHYVHVVETLINRLKKPSGPCMTERGLASGGKSSSGYSTQLIRSGSSGSSTRTGDQTGAVVVARESLRGWGRGESTGKRERSHLGRSPNYEWMAEHVFFFLSSHCVLTYHVIGGIKQKWHRVLSLSQHSIIGTASTLIAVRRQKHC